MKDITITDINEYINLISKAQAQAIENGLTDLILTTSKENISYIHEFVKIPFVNVVKEINGIYGMKIRIVDNLPKDINFIITQDVEIIKLRKKVMGLENIIREIKELL